MYMPRNNSSTLYHRYGAAHDGWQDCSGAGGHANTARMHKICVRILRRKLKEESNDIINESLAEEQ